MNRVSKQIVLGALAPVPLIAVHLSLGYSRDVLIGVMGLDSFYFGLKYSVLLLLALTTIGLGVVTRKMPIAEMAVTVCVFAILIGVYAGTTYVVQIGHSGHWGFAGRDVVPFFKYLFAVASAVVVLAALVRAAVQIFGRR
jgi:hypothetical protein